MSESSALQAGPASETLERLHAAAKGDRVEFLKLCFVELRDADAPVHLPDDQAG